MKTNTASKRRLLACAASVFLLLALLFSSLGAVSIRASAAGNETEESITESRAVTTSVPATLSPVSDRSVWKYPSLPISLWGSSVNVSARLINGTVYIPTRAFSEKLGLRVQYNSSTRTLTVSGSGIYITVSDGSYVTYANDRPLFTGANSVIMSDGRMYTPAGTLMKAFGLRYTRTASGVSVTGTYSPLLHASKFYRSDEVLWLSRIISAESRGEPLLGQIAVGSVVMNRVASSSYPNTIYGVIFDRRYGVQFSPILDGSIYNTPTYNCTLAAKICLEGVRVGEGAMFFLRPEASNSLWIPASRPYLFSIGHHDFYA